ncbi:MAG: hypothetical protein FWF03_03395, partial [Defluviitaleaceae bacterium]|nr:hypothetical protein [Defluviitaleaceae bacterium]
MNRLKKYMSAFLAAAVIISASPQAGPMVVRAQLGDMGFFGGISEGRRLPSTTEILIAEKSSSSGKASSRETFNYKEFTFINGRPQEINGLIEIAIGGGVVPGQATGSFSVGYRVFPSPDDNNASTISR